MIASHAAHGASEAVTAPDRPWRGLYRAGAVAAALYVLLIVIPIVLLNVAPVPPQSGGAAILDYIAAHKLVYLIELISFVGFSLPAMIVFLALYMATRDHDPSSAALGATIGIVGETLRDVIGPGYYIYGLLLPSWFLAVGWKLYRLGKD